MLCGQASPIRDEEITHEELTQPDLNQLLKDKADWTHRHGHKYCSFLVITEVCDKQG